MENRKNVGSMGDDPESWGAVKGNCKSDDGRIFIGDRVVKLNLDSVKVVCDYSNGEAVDIKRCLETLYQTPEGSCPLDRDFGLDIGLFVGGPINEETKNILAVEILNKTERYEPRAKIEKMNFKMDIEGKTIIEVVLTNV